MDDLISRKDALRPFCINSKGERIPERDCDNWQVQIPIAEVKKILRALPSAEPQIVMCQHCKEFDENHHYCTLHDIEMSLTDFCSYAERRTDG